MERVLLMLDELDELHVLADELRRPAAFKVMVLAALTLVLIGVSASPWRTAAVAVAIGWAAVLLAAVRERADRPRG